MTNRTTRTRTRTRSILTAAMALLAAAAGCAPSELADPAPEYDVVGLERAAAGAGIARAPAADLTLWCADAELEAWVRDEVAPRILAASGLIVAVTNHTADADAPVFWVDREDWAADGWWGLAHMPGEQPDYIAIGEGVPGYMIGTVLVHEVLHALGAHHVGQGLGIMSPQAAEPFPITEADLEALCVVRDCPTFQPEN